MTRINVGILPSELSNKHLIAEHREIKRIPNTIRSGKADVSLSNIPVKFTLGKGHVKFFYDKQKYLLRRYKAIHFECKKRGFDVTDYSEAWDGIPEYLNNDYTPTGMDRILLIERLMERDFTNYILLPSLITTHDRL